MDDSDGEMSEKQENGTDYKAEEELLGEGHVGVRGGGKRCVAATMIVGRGAGERRGRGANCGAGVMGKKEAGRMPVPGVELDGAVYIYRQGAQDGVLHGPIDIIYYDMPRKCIYERRIFNNKEMRSPFKHKFINNR